MGAGGEQGHVSAERSVIRSADQISGPRRCQRIESAGSWVAPDQRQCLSAVLLDFPGG